MMVADSAFCLGSMLNREPSPSPSLRERPRAAKVQSMPLIPTTALFAAQQGSPNQPQQSSPTIPSTSARRSPPPGQISRVLPTPPHPNPPNFVDDRRMSPAPGSQQVHGVYRPPLRTSTTFTGLHNHLAEFELSPQFLADIELADQQYQSLQPSHSYPAYNAGLRDGSPSSGKAPNSTDRGRGPTNGAANGASPDQTQQRGWSQPQRESPKGRDRPSVAANGAAPLIPGSVSGQSHTPEHRMSPNQHTPHVIPGEPHPSSYLAQFGNREPAASMRRAPPTNEGRLSVSMASQTPPLQNVPTRTPDRSLPVQEEDEVTAKNNGGAWQINDQPTAEQHFRSSPTPSSDLNSDSGNQRFDSGIGAHSNHRDEDQLSHKHENNHAQYAKRDTSPDEDGSYTPRSPTTGLPEADSFYANQGHATVNAALPAPRAKARNGSLDQIMLELESSIQESSAPHTPPPQQSTDRSPNYPADVRQQSGNGSALYPNYPPSETNGYNPGHQEHDSGNNGNRYIPPRVYPDDFHSNGEESPAHLVHSFFRQYHMSPRPDAPIPPTPHSQTAAPSPSPLLSEYGREMLAHRALRAAGSPYPFPYNHVRRNRQMAGSNGANEQQILAEQINEQITRQWQIYAQNMGQITDSTLSPSSTPFQGELFEHWADMHIRRSNANARNIDTASIRSSPSHQPVALPLPPVLAAAARKNHYQPKRHNFTRKPPPRVESTQPRETSPELSSSGEETSVAGEERPHSAPAGRVTSASVPPPISTNIVLEHDDSDEWIDEDEDDVYEDLIELEYHPGYVRNSSKRRRKWEVGWENLIQAVCR